MLRAEKEEDEILVEIPREEFILKAQNAYDALTKSEKIYIEAKRNIQELVITAVNYEGDRNIKVRFYQRASDKALTIKAEPKERMGFSKYERG